MLGCLGKRVLVAVSVTLLAPSMALAQAGGRIGFLEGGLVVSRQSGPSGTVSETYVTAPGGTTTGWSIGGGVDIAGHTGVVVEWSTTGWMKAEEPSRYFTTYDEARRDRTLIAGVRFVVRLGPAIALEPLAGVSFTMEDATSQAVSTDPLALRAPAPLVTHALDVGVGPVIGVDCLIGSGRFAVVPTFRMNRTGINQGRYDDTPNAPVVDVESIYPGGYPKWALRVGAAARVRF